MSLCTAALVCSLVLFFNVFPLLSAYADQAPKDFDTNFEPAPNQVIVTQQGESDAASEAADPAQGAGEANANESAGGLTPDAETDPAVSPEVVEAEPWRLGAWFVENDKQALQQAQQTVADRGSPDAPPGQQTNTNEAFPATREWINPTLLLTTGAVLCLALGAGALAKSRSVSRSADIRANIRHQQITEKTVR